MNNDLSSSGFITEGELVDEKTIIELKKLHTSSSGFNELWEFRRLGKLHILKCLQPIYRNDPFYKKLLKKEFDIAYQLEHIHICRTLGWEKHQTQGDCILMEYIDGETLESFIEKGRLTTDLAIKFINELCDALQYIHSKQVIHRDLKPANILITHNGNNVKLIDFGLSDCDDYHILKIPAGTRQYIAPEQMQKDMRTDARADIYSLGVIILEMGKRLNNRHLMTVARKCLAKNRERRFASMAEVRKAINTKNHKKRYYFTVAIIGTLLAMAVALFFLNQKKTPKYLPESLGTEETYSNYVVTNHHQQALLNGAAEQDSLLAAKAIREALQVQFPMAIQRETTIYSKALFYNTQEIFPGSR